MGVDEFCVEVSGDDSAVVVTVAGELDAVSGPILKGSLDSLEHTHRVLLEMGAVTFIDSTGLRVILESAIESCRQGGSLRIRSASTQVHRLLHITNLDDLLERDEAA